VHVQWVVPGLAAAAGVHAALGRLDEARGLLAEVEAYPNARNEPTRSGCPSSCESPLQQATRTSPGASWTACSPGGR
jgi:hypothetical protein